MQMCPNCDKVYDESEYTHCPYCSSELEDDEEVRPCPECGGCLHLGMFKLFLFRRRLEKVNREPKYDLMRADQILWSALKF